MPRAARSTNWGLFGLLAVVAVTIGLLVAFAPNRGAKAAGGLPLTAALPDTIPAGTVLTVGDPVTRWVVEHNGWDKGLPFTIKWAQITGGPDVTEAFHAKALDVGLSANIPPIHAVWVGLPVKVIAFRLRRDPIAHPSFVLGLAPKSGIRTIADLKGKRIAFSPSQVQSQIVIETLKAAGLTARDVTLVELPSSIGGDVYTSALASNVVDMAPIGGGIVAERYLRKYGGDGARVINPIRHSVTMLSSLMSPTTCSPIRPRPPPSSNSLSFGAAHRPGCWRIPTSSPAAIMSVSRGCRLRMRGWSSRPRGNPTCPPNGTTPCAISRRRST